MADRIKITKGLDLKLEGVAENRLRKVEQPKLFGIKPTDFQGVNPKLSVKEGDAVQVGSVLFYDKQTPAVKFVSPASGTVKSIVRGERRKLLEVSIESDGQFIPLELEEIDIVSATREELVGSMQASGLWPLIKQRPFDIIADGSKDPKAIYISCFDSSPHGIDLDFIIQGKEKEFQKGIDVLNKLTSGYIHLGLDHCKASKMWKEVKGVRTSRFEGPHPSGNVGIQIAQVDPVEKGESVWTLGVSEVAAIGERFLKNVYPSERTIAIVGSEVEKPTYVKTYIGAQIEPLVKGHLKEAEGHKRYISGSILSGTHISPQGYLGTYDNQLVVIPEGDDYRFMGWITPNTDKFSVYRTSLSWIFKREAYRLGANINGGERPIIFSNEYDRVLPMNIMPEFLIKAILAQDIDKMEQLGIYEVAPEDFALCEFVCTSKLNIQQIVRSGLDLMIKETN